MQFSSQSRKKARSGPVRSHKAAQPELVPERLRQRYEYYRGLAESSGEDRIARENYWQHAEHFLRTLTERKISSSHALPPG